MLKVGPNKVLTIENFLSDDECNELTAWTIEHQMEPYFKNACGRSSTRHASIDVSFPKKVYEVQRKIVNLLGLYSIPLAPFFNGIYSGLSRNENEFVYHAHRDPVYIPGTYTLHCNVVTTNSLGGEVKIEDQVYEMKKGKLVVYPVSEMTHEVFPAKSKNIRNLWVFGFCVPWGFK